MLKRLTFLSVLVAVLLMWGLPVMAAEPAADQAENIVPSAGAKAPGDILWHCDVQSIPDDDQILGIETFRDTIYITGAGGTTHGIPNWVHVWTIPGGVCTYQYSVAQPTGETWGWRDIACDGQYLYASDSPTLTAFTATPAGVTTYPAASITVNLAQMPTLNPVRAVAYDEDNDWFWAANFSNPIYAFDRNGNMMATAPNLAGPAYGMAYDNSTPGGPYLWLHIQDSTNVYQFHIPSLSFTGVIYSGWGDGDPGVSGIAGGLCVMEGDPSKGKGSVTLMGIMQGSPFDEMWAMEIYVHEEQWDHKMHFPQLPDEIGWDVNATFPKTLADDWECSQTGWVTDIHFWGSWRQDQVMTPMPWFILSIHDNIPASADTPWSRPGQELWHWEGEIMGTPFDPPTYEGWYDPNTGEWFCNDHTSYWRYDFFVAQAWPEADSFFQYEGQIYWLNVSAVIEDTFYQWGWKNSRDHFMDDAVYTDFAPDGPWFEMYEPPRCNWFDVYFGPYGTPPEDLGSTNYYGQGWYFYEMYSWWNMWFYNNPFTYTNPKHIWLEFYVDFPYPHSWAEFAINWSTDYWSMEGEPGRPPLPADGNEDLYIGRYEQQVFPGWNTVDFWITDYNPEWVSIDFRAEDVMINGWIWHECVGTSMDLAFVITGHEGEPPVVCGDVNNNGVVDVGDVVYLVTYLYRSGPAPIPMVCVGDVNNNDIVDVGDLVYLVSYLYRSGPAPNPNCCNPPWK